RGPAEDLLQEARHGDPPPTPAQAPPRGDRAVADHVDAPAPGRRRPVREPAHHDGRGRPARHAEPPVGEVVAHVEPVEDEAVAATAVVPGPTPSCTTRSVSTLVAPRRAPRSFSWLPPKRISTASVTIRSGSATSSMSTMRRWL